MVDRRVTAIIPAWELEPELCLRRLAGWPSIAYSLAAGVQTPQVDRVIMAASDPRVLAQAAGFENVTPVCMPHEFLPGFEFRPAALEFLAREAGPFGEILVWLSPRTPLRPCGLVAEAITQIDRNAPAGRIVSVTHPDNSLAGLKRINQGGELEAVEVENWQSVVFESAHVEAVRLSSPDDTRSLTLPLYVDPIYAPDITSPLGWERAEWLVRRSGPRLVHPRGAPRPLPERVDLLVMDFDGVLTDNRVFVDQDGRESAAAYRSDSLGLTYLQRAGIPALVISMETNPVVAARCRKMKVPYLQGIEDKATVLLEELTRRGVNPANVVYLGNDTNDLPCFPIVGCAVVVADTIPRALEAADLVLERPGGYGAVRELCDILIEKVQKANGTVG